MWYDNVTDAEIDELKNNKLPYCFLPRNRKDCFCAIEPEHLAQLNEDGSWETAARDITGGESIISDATTNALGASLLLGQYNLGQA